MAAPTVTSVTPNGGSAFGGTAIVIAGANYANITGVTVAGKPVKSFKVESTTEITATTEPSQGIGGTQYLAQTGAVIVTGKEGSNAGTGHAEFFTYSEPQTHKLVDNRLVETVPLGAAKSAAGGPGGEKIDQSGLNFTGTTVKTIPLEGDYSAYDYIEIEVNTVAEGTDPTAKITVDTSYDGGATWSTGALGISTTTVVPGTPLFLAGKTPEVEIGPLLRLSLKPTQTGILTGTITVYAQTSSALRK